jgi:hypothetical protein
VLAAGDRQHRISRGRETDARDQGMRRGQRGDDLLRSDVDDARDAIAAQQGGPAAIR